MKDFLYSYDYYGPTLPRMGIKIITSPHMTYPKEVPRTLRERLFTRPWKPLRKTKIIQVPSKEAYQLSEDTFVMHPEIQREFLSKVEQKNESR